MSWSLRLPFPASAMGALSWITVAHLKPATSNPSLRRLSQLSVGCSGAFGSSGRRRSFETKERARGAGKVSDLDGSVGRRCQNVEERSPRDTDVFGSVHGVGAVGLGFKRRHPTGAASRNHLEA